MQRDALAGQQGAHAFGDERLGIDLVDHAEQVAHVASGGNRKLHAAFNGLGGGFERVGGSGELLVDDLGRVEDHAGEGVVGRGGHDQLIAGVPIGDDVLVERQSDMGNRA